MTRSSHGVVFDFDAFTEARKAMETTGAKHPLGFAVAARPVVTEDFGFLFGALQEDETNLLPTDRATRDGLIELGESMRDAGKDSDSRDSHIPAAYTYFGQFLDHDITLELESGKLVDLTSEDLAPLSAKLIDEGLENARRATLDLDNVYGIGAPRDKTKMMLGIVSQSGDRPPNKDDENDLPRRPRNSSNLKEDREALIGDPRNDENLVVAQMHVAFLRAHNRLIDQGKKFQVAQRTLRRHYQHIVLHDFLKRIVDPRIVDDLIENGNRIYDPEGEHFFMPLEFSVAAYRFGHSMIRSSYNHNLNFPEATLNELFMFTAFSGQMAEFDTVPENWIIEWENLVPGFGEFDKARRIDTKLVEPLSELKDFDGSTLSPVMKSLAVRNLLRGYLLRMPTGQAVARELRRKLSGFRHVPILKAQEIKAGAASQRQVKVLEKGGFLNHTPLWFYILAEAATRGDGQRLGPVGGTIVAEVLVGLIRRSENSILRMDSWEPTLPAENPGEFTLNDLLRFAGVLS